MQHSSELAESHRPLTVTDEVNTAQTERYAFKDAIIPERKSNLPLPDPLSLDDFEALMLQRQPLARPGTARYGAAVYPSGVKGRTKIEPTSRRPIGSNDPHHNLYSWKDNTVGPVTLASGYGSNTFPCSAAHVLDPITMPITTSVVNSDLVIHDEGLSNPFWAPSKILHFTVSFVGNSKSTFVWL